MMGCMPRLVDSSDFFILEGRGALFCYGQGIEGSNFINRERLIDSDFFIIIGRGAFVFAMIRE